MDQEKKFESYMFSCSNGMNIVIEAESKLKAIELFEHGFRASFNGDWKVFRVDTRLDIKGYYTRY